MVCDTPYLQNEFGDPRFFYVFNLILSFSTCSQSFKKICTWELLGANVLKWKNGPPPPPHRLCTNPLPVNCQRWRHRKPDLLSRVPLLSSVPLQNNACTAGYLLQGNKSCLPMIQGIYTYKCDTIIEASPDKEW